MGNASHVHPQAERVNPSEAAPADGRPNGHEPENGHHDHHRRDPRPLGGYVGILASYGSLSVALAVALRHKGRRVRPLSPWNLALYALATEHLSRLLTKDSVTSPVRRPFAEFEEPAGEGEVNEKVIGHGARHAIGELLTCPFCLGQWVATGLVAGSVAAPTLTTAVVSVSAMSRVADYLQLFYGFLRERVE
jgi:hypothetical protein